MLLCLTVAGVLLVPAALGVASGPITITIRPAFASEPGGVRIVAEVEPHRQNRWLVIEADSPAFFRASRRQLDGENAARRHTLVLTGMPAGKYVIKARVLDSDGIRAVDACDFRVIGRQRH
jgi:hypothetical protein